MSIFRALMVLAFALVTPAAAAAQTDTTTTTTSTDDAGVATDSGSFETADGSLTDRPFFVGAGLGLRAGLQSGGWVSFQLEEHVGYRIFGFDLADRLDAALWVGGGFGQAFGDFSSVLLNFDGRFGADFEVWDGGDMQLLATPFIGLGGGVVIFNGGLANTTDGAFHMQFAAQAELVLVDGLLGIFLRPLSFDFYIWNNTWSSYQLLTGVNIRL